MEQERARLHLRLLGPPVVTLDGEPFLLARRQARALLYYLAAQGGAVPRDQLSFLFWPDIPQSKARRNLTRLLSYLRQALPGDVLVNSLQKVSLKSYLVWCDSPSFESLCASGAPAELTQAIELYNGSFLQGFSLPNSREFDMWLSREQERYERLYLSALAGLMEQAASGGDEATAITYARKYLAVDELTEEVHRRLISLYGATGDRSAAQRQYEKCIAILERELGVAPLPETRAAFKAAISEPSTEAKPAADMGGAQPAWATLPSLKLPLVGREEAWKALVAAFRRYRNGGVIFVAGEPGIGKSRLMQEFATKQQHCLVLAGNSHETTRDLPYRPLSQAMRQALTQPSLWAHIEPIWLAEATRILPELRSQFPGLRQPLEVTPDQAQARLFEAIGQIFLGLATKIPVLLCLDDLHWADEATLGWLNYLGNRLAESGLCLVATYRSQEAASLAGVRDTLGRAGCQTTIALAGLSVKAIECLLRELTESVPAPKALAATLRQATGGNAFFTLETIRSLWESGQLTSPPATLPLPGTVQEAIRGRLARLGPIERQILDAAAVLSPHLAFELVGETAGRSEGETLDGLDRLSEHQILMAEADGLCFQHELFKSVVYAEMNPWRRRSLHRRAAESLSGFHRREPERVAAQVAQHYDVSGNVDLALTWYASAAEAAQRSYANDEATGLLRQAIALLDDPPRDPAAATRLYELLAHSLLATGQAEAADAAYRRALAHCPEQEPLWRADLSRKLAATYTAQGRMWEVDEAFEKARSALGADPADFPAVRWWQVWLGVQLGHLRSLYSQNRPDDMQVLAAEIEHVLDQYGTLAHRLDYLAALGMQRLRYRRFDPTADDLRITEKGVELAYKLGNEVRICQQVFGLGFVLLWAGRLGEAHEQLELALAKAEAIAYLPVQDQCLIYLTIVSRLAGDVARARVVQARSIEITRHRGVPYYVGAAEANQVWLDYLDGHWDLAVASGKRVLETWRSAAYPFHWLAHWPLLAIALAREELAAAVTSAEAMLDPAQQRLPDDVTGALERAVRAWEAGDLEANRRTLKQALTLAEDRGYL